MDKKEIKTIHDAWMKVVNGETEVATEEVIQESTIQESTVSEVEEDVTTSYNAEIDSIRAGLMQMWEAAADSKKKQTKDATKPEDIDDHESEGSKEFAKDHEGEVVLDQEDSHDETKKATQMKQAPGRSGDSKSGDKTPVKPVDKKV